jgi:TRAP-type C4-dicarboxylate transport system substrate-binding protein
MNRIIGLFSLLTLLVAAAPGRAAEYVITMASVAPDGSLWMEEMKKMDSLVRSATGGEVRFEFYPGSIAGDDKTVVKKIQSGQLVAAGLTGVGLGEIVPAFRVMELPFTYRSYDEVDFVLRKLSKWFSTRFEEKGFVVLGFADQGFVYLLSKNPITKTADMKTAKPWVWDVDRLAAAAFKAFGINAIPLSLENVTTALDTGKIDTVYISPVAGIALQWYRKTGYLVDFPLTDGAGALVISKKFFDALPEKHRAAVVTVCRETSKNLRSKTRADNDAALKLLKAKGTKFVSPAPEELQNFLLVGDKAAASLVGELYSQALLDKVRALLAEYRTAKK